MQGMIYLQLHMRFCKIEVRLNDIVLYRKNEPEISTVALPVHEYLITGQNEFSVRVLPHTSDVDFDSKTLLWARIARFQEGEFLAFTGGDASAEMSLELNTIPPEKIKRRYQYKTTFLHNSPKTWLWQTAQIVEFSQPLIKELNDFVAMLHNAFIKRQPQAIISALRPKLEEQALCYPQRPVEERIQAYEKLIRGEGKKRIVEPLNPSNANYHVAANGRLVEVIGNDGLPLIRTQTNNYDSPNQQEGYTALPMHIGKHGEQLVILR